MFKKIITAALVGATIFGLGGAALTFAALGFCYAAGSCEPSVNRLVLVPFFVLAGGCVGAVAYLITDVVRPWAEGK